MKKAALLSLMIFFVLTACKKDTKTTSSTPAPAPPRLVFKFKFDSTQVRLNAVGQPDTIIPSNHGTQSPRFNGMSAHYIEMAATDTTGVGRGAVIYIAPKVTTGITTGTYTDAIDFDKCTIVGNNQEFFSIPLSQVHAGTYKWLRVSLAYQNYDIKYRYTYNSVPYHFTGTVASFIGYSTYLSSYKIKTQTISGINTNKLQGYWGFETTTTIGSVTTTTTSTGQAPAGATTVVNPLFATSPIPAGSCLATGQFKNTGGNAQMLTITGNETKDIVIVVSLSTNKSFEWTDVSSDNDYEPAAGDAVVDMGIRGLIPFIEP
ncbi:MAG TPA: hypothetical protein VNY73_03205 [Bacteroidia bacterium]|jgi:hypothetical protein|nr:hypothetical protein [Bacteroidia bacterium]